jgi:meiotic recombination protein SPO11
MRWIGIKSSQLILIREGEFMDESREASSGLLVNQNSNLTTATTRTSVASTSCQDPVTYLSLRDRKTATAALRSTCGGTDDLEMVELQRELQVMLLLGTKAEIEWLDECGNLFQWLDREIGRSLS